MKFPLVCLGAAAALTLAACGDRATDMSVPDIPDLPLQTPLHALQTTIHVGADVAAPADALQQAALHGETRVFHGSVQDGIGADEVIAYLQADAASLQNPEEEDGMSVDLIPEGLLLRFGPVPPTVRVVDGTPPALIDETVRVVQAINAALPIDWQLEVNRDPAPAGTVTPLEGEILVAFAPEEDWPQEAAPPIDENIGLAEPLFAVVPTEDPDAPFRIEIGGGRVFVDHTRTEGLERLGVIAHELIHLLGRSHVDPIRFPRTIMVGGGSEELSPHILHPLDREPSSPSTASWSREPRQATSRKSWETGRTPRCTCGARSTSRTAKSLSAPRAGTACLSPGRPGHRPTPLSRTTRHSRTTSPGSGD